MYKALDDEQKKLGKLDLWEFRFNRGEVRSRPFIGRALSSNDFRTCQHSGIALSS